MEKKIEKSFRMFIDRMQKYGKYSINQGQLIEARRNLRLFRDAVGGSNSTLSRLAETVIKMYLREYNTTRKVCCELNEIRVMIGKTKSCPVNKIIN